MEKSEQHGGGRSKMAKGWMDGDFANLDEKNISYIHFLFHHPNEAPKPRLPDPIDHPIAVMPPSRMKKPTLAMPLIEDLSRYGIEDCSYSPEAPKSNAYSFPFLYAYDSFMKIGF
ncbi:hypothetical protein TNCV_3153801 [Trichonephila clavipes]|nr:hypothetical protein TNCV_3153801 [Trichonephila clavipes]